MAVVLSDHQKKKIKELEGKEKAGKGVMKAKVLAFYKDHEGMSINEMAKQLGMNYATVRHAILSSGKAPVATKVSRAKKVDDLPEEHRKANEIEGFCPKCGKPLTAHVCAVTLHNETYKKSAIGTCGKCGTSFSYHVN